MKKIDYDEGYEHGFDDGVGQSQKEYKRQLISNVENKSNFVNAYANGPLLKDSLIITMDDWLEIKKNLLSIN